MVKKISFYQSSCRGFDFWEIVLCRPALICHSLWTELFLLELEICYEKKKSFDSDFDYFHYYYYFCYCSDCFHCCFHCC